MEIVGGGEEIVGGGGNKKGAGYDDNSDSMFKGASVSDFFFITDPNLK